MEGAENEKDGWDVGEVKMIIIDLKKILKRCCYACSLYKLN